MPASDDRRALLSAPVVAWPTVFLAVGGLVLFGLGVGLGTAGRVAPSVAFALSTAGAYACFTPTHEAAHRAVTRTRWVNEIVGRLTAIPLLGAFGAFRVFHLDHHKHTNEPDADPDYWSGRGPWFLLPLRWATQDLRYYGLYAKRLSSRPAREWLEILATMALYVAVIVAAVVSGHGGDLLLFWILPARLVVTFLGFSFDWLPHRPHNVPAKVDPMQATRVIEGGLGLFVVLFGQSHHLVHHLYPAVPFYRYTRVWRAGLCEKRRPSAA